MPKKLAAGNWKMNGLAAQLAELPALVDAIADTSCDVLLCPPATLIDRMSSALAGTSIATGGQDCHAAASGAHTGDTSTSMLKDAGASYVIIGHSERRTDHGETDADIAAKAEAAWANGLIAVICVGETEAERDAGDAISVVSGQLAASIPDGATAANSVIAYEPVWAIGTGRVPTTEQIIEIHDDMRAKLGARFGDEGTEMSLLYGGSVKAGNAAEIFGVTNVNGALVGGASLKAADFAPIVLALDAS